MTEKLKPCKNCGGKGKITPYIIEWDNSICGCYVECESCGATTYVCECEKPAVDDWNDGYVKMRY